MADGFRPRVLVVDDERDFTELLAEFLEQEGFRVDRAYDGEQALRILQAAEPPEVVLSDVMMPRVRGTELVAAARSLYPAGQVHFILLSAGRDPGLVAEGVRFMAKPLDFERLLREVRTLAQGHAQPTGRRASPASPAARPTAVTRGRA
jgi:DNA-binding response OmpR family regulator